MTESEAIELIKLGVGYPLVDVEFTDSQMGLFLKRAVLDAAPHYDEIASFRTTYASRIALPDDCNMVLDIVEVALDVSENADSFDVFAGSLSRKTEKMDIGFYEEGGYVFPDQYAVIGGVITIRYFRKLVFVNIVDEFWLSWLVRAATAYFKVSLGSAYRKFRIAEAPYELNGEELVNEGNTELQELRNEIWDRGMGALLISR